MIAHVGGLPLEETVPALASWAGAGLWLTRGWLRSRASAIFPALEGRAAGAAKRTSFWAAR